MEDAFSFLAAFPAVPAGVGLPDASACRAATGGEQLRPLTDASRLSPASLVCSLATAEDADLAIKSTRQLMTSEKLLGGFLEADRAAVEGAAGTALVVPPAGVDHGTSSVAALEASPWVDSIAAAPSVEVVAAATVGVAAAATVAVGAESEVGGLSLISRSAPAPSIPALESIRHILETTSIKTVGSLDITLDIEVRNVPTWIKDVHCDSVNDQIL